MDNITMKKIGTRINSELAKNEITQKQLAQHLGVTDNTVSYWCNGHRAPNLEQVIKIASLFDVSIDYLTGVTDEKIALNDEKGILLREIYEYTGLSSHAVEILETLKSFGYTNYCDLINRIIEDLQPELDSLSDYFAFSKKTLFTMLVQYMETDFLNNSKKISISSAGNLLDLKNTTAEEKADYRNMFILKEMEAGKIIEQVLRNDVYESLKRFKQQNDLSESIFPPDKRAKEISIDDIDNDDLPF